MPVQHFVWNEPQTVPPATAENLDLYSEPFQSILFQRGISTADEAMNFLMPKDLDWYSRSKLRQVDTACQLIHEAVTNQNPIAIYGDYDADGITSTAILTLVLKKIGASVFPYLPNRFKSGYGLNEQVIDELFEQGIRLLITADNGIRSILEVEHAKELGLKVIITDHHEPDNDLPPADALLNPKSPDDNYPNKHLAGVGVIYKLISSLETYFPIINARDYLDLVAIGTVADVVPLTGENRYLVRQGLAILNNFQRQGIVSLVGAANLNHRKIRSSDISFQIAPRINSTGRLDVDQSDTPLKLLISSDPRECGSLAQELEVHNNRRKNLSRDLQMRIEADISDPRPTIITSFDENNHLGVAGIAAGYLARKFYSPVIIGHKGPETTTASCRSISEFNLIDALSECKDLFLRYGGHKMAAGFTVQNEHIDALTSRLELIAHNILSGLELRPNLDLDAEITLSQINESLFKELDKLEPTGSHNKQALFITRNLFAKSKTKVGKDSSHLKMTVSDGQNFLDAIGFGFGNISDSLPELFDLVYALTINKYRGKKSYQLLIQDIRPS